MYTRPAFGATTSKSGARTSASGAETAIRLPSIATALPNRSPTVEETSASLPPTTATGENVLVLPSASVAVATIASPSMIVPTRNRSVTGPGPFTLPIAGFVPMGTAPWPDAAESALKNRTLIG